MNKILKAKILNWLFENENQFNRVNACIAAFREYIYDKKGNYLIGGQTVLEFIKDADKLIYGKNETEDSSYHIWKIPVTWEVCGSVLIPAKTLKEAMEIVKNDDTIPVPKGEYVDGSWSLSSDDEQFVLECFNKDMLKKGDSGKC